ncbi:MAG: hypothetical protein HOL84_08870 [Nitrospina sp.]|nr:hypothetical protein [Nitrospina sp.]
MADIKPKQGKWSKKGVPHKGWVCFDVEDLKEPSQVCEMCESQKIRYVHYMEHDDFEDTLGVGCICAGHMEENYERAEAREKKLKTAARHRTNWSKGGWKTSAKGNDYKNVDGFNIVIFFKNNKWSYVIKFINTDESKFSPRKYETEGEAKLAAFDSINFLKK